MPPIDTEEVDTVQAPQSLRDTLNASFDAAVAEEGMQEPEVDEEAAPPEGETQEQADQRARDEAGRFAKQPKAAKKPEVKPAAAVAAKPPTVRPGVKPEAAPVPTSAPQPAEPQMKAPQAWRDGAKKAWASLPEEARVEVLRREKEFSTALAGAAEDRKYAQTLRSTIAPFEAQIRAEGSTPEKAIASLLQTGMALRTAPPAHKAQLVAGLINDFGIDLNHLVQALQGQVPRGGPQQPSPQQIDPNSIAKQVMENITKTLGSQREAALIAQSKAVMEKELSGKAMHGLDGTDYTEEIHDSMADFIESAAKRGRSISLEQAYTMAAQMHPEVSKVLERQKQAASATKKNQTTQQVRAAASSVRSSPATTPVRSGQGMSLRESLEAAVDSLE